MKYPFNKADCPRHSGGQERILRKQAPGFCRCAKATARLNEIRRCCSVRVIICEHVILVVHPVRIQWLHKFRSSLVPRLPVTFFFFFIWQKVCGCARKLYPDTVWTVAHLLCVGMPSQPPHCAEKKRSRSRRLFPHVNLPHEFSLVALLYNTSLPNTAIRELSHSHYFEYIIILAALSHPAHHHFSLFSFFWIDKSFTRRENQVTWNTDASIARFIGSRAFAYVAGCRSASHSALNGRSRLSQYWHWLEI